MRDGAYRPRGGHARAPRRRSVGLATLQFASGVPDTHARTLSLAGGSPPDPHRSITVHSFQYGHAFAAPRGSWSAPRSALPATTEGGGRRSCACYPVSSSPGCSGSYLDGCLFLLSWSPGDALFFARWSCKLWIDVVSDVRLVGG